MTPFLCLVVAVSDADSLRCSTGQRVRIAAISALERDGSCNSRLACPTMAHRDAQPIVEAMTIGRTLSCRKVGVSYRRTVAQCTLPNGRDLGCSIIATGAAVDWPAYRVRYRMEGCR